MKIQKFYPTQVIRKLNGRKYDSLDSGEKAAVQFFFRNSRKVGVNVAVMNKQSMKQLMAGTTKHEAKIVLANSNPKIMMNTA